MGRKNYAAEEASISAYLELTKVEQFVENNWITHSPQHIAGLLSRRKDMGIPWITARWVESIKRRIDNRKRAAEKE